MFFFTQNNNQTEFTLKLQIENTHTKKKDIYTQHTRHKGWLQNGTFYKKNTTQDTLFYQLTWKHKIITTFFEWSKEPERRLWERERKRRRKLVEIILYFPLFCPKKVKLRSKKQEYYYTQPSFYPVSKNKTRQLRFVFVWC